MQLKVFSISAQGGDEAAEELNRFLRGHRVIAVKRRLIEPPGGAYWTFCVEYLERGGEGGGSIGAADRTRRGIDYKEVLNEADFVVFAKLRDLRKVMAEKEGVPAYSVFTNEQLAAMVTGKVDTLAAMGTIPGVGAARLEKYGAAFLARPAAGARDGWRRLWRLRKQPVAAHGI